MLRPVQLYLIAALAYAGVAVAATWPLAASLSTMLPGAPSGDTGVYVWNLWSFAHELAAGRFPLYTSTAFVMTPGVDLSLHNYTIVHNLLAWPLLVLWSPTVVYNVLLMLTLVVNGVAGFALCRRVVGGVVAPWLGGLAFGFSPFVLARAGGHMSLVAVAPLACFWLGFESWRRTGRLRPALGTGVSFVWALFSDPYYAVYCILLAAMAVVPIRIDREGARRLWARRTARGLVVLAALAFALGAAIVVSGGGTIVWAGLPVHLHTAYTPMLVATLAALGWYSVRARWRLTWAPDRLGAISWTTLGASALAALVPMTPWLVALSSRLAAGERFSEPVLWRSSSPGMDLVGLLTPNPHHAFWPGLPGWLEHLPGGLIENVGGIPLVVAAVIGLAAWRYRDLWPRWWIGITISGGLLALGPFIHVAGLNTCIPGPWALLRYVPVLSSARTPARFAAVMSLGLAVLFALAVARILRDAGRRARWAGAAVAALLLLEVAPGAVTLHSAAVPSVYDVIAQDPRPVRVMHLPFGLRDGTRTIGGYNNARLYYQTYHHKASLGGYISRLGKSVIRRQRQSRVVRTLLYLSQGGPPLNLSPSVVRARGARLVRRVNLGYVVVNRQTAPAALVEYARASFGLVPVSSSGSLDLYRVTPVASDEAIYELGRVIPHARGVTHYPLLPE